MVRRAIYSACAPDTSMRWPDPAALRREQQGDGATDVVRESHAPEGDLRRERTVELPIVADPPAAEVGLEAGLGIIQAPRMGAQQALASGVLIEVLPELASEPMPVSIVHTRNVPKRVRAVMDWLARQLAPHLERPG